MKRKRRKSCGNNILLWRDNLLFLIFVSIFVQYICLCFVALISLCVIYLSIFFYFILIKLSGQCALTTSFPPQDRVRGRVFSPLDRVRGRVYLPPIKLSIQNKIQNTKFLTATPQHLLPANTKYQKKHSQKHFTCIYT